MTDKSLADAIREAGHEIAEAITLLARATAGEFDERQEPEGLGAQSLSDVL